MIFAKIHSITAFFIPFIKPIKSENYMRIYNSKNNNMLKQIVKIHSKKNLIINCNCFFKTQKLKPLIIFTHGFKGFKDWGGFPYLMEKISSEEFGAVSYNFSHNGVSEKNPVEFTRLDLFSQNTFSLELNELSDVINFFSDNADDFMIDKNRMALIGHSRGGGISILSAADDKRIKCLVTLSSVSGFDRYSDKLKLEWKKKGYIESENTRTKQLMRLNVSLLEDLENNKDTLNIISAASRLKIPALFIHGKEDLAVKYHEAEEIFESTDKQNKELFFIENTGHTFGVIHPFAGTTPAFDIVIEKIIGFLKKYL